MSNILQRISNWSEDTAKNIVQQWKQLIHGASQTKRRLRMLSRLRNNEHNATATVQDNCLTGDLLKSQLGRQASTRKGITYLRAGKLDFAGPLPPTAFEPISSHTELPIVKPIVIYSDAEIESGCPIAFLSEPAKEAVMQLYSLKSPQEDPSPEEVEKAEQFGWAEGMADDFKPDQSLMRQMSAAQEILFHMASDPDENVRTSVAQNEHTPPETFWMLLDDSSVMVRRRLAENDKCPLPILDGLVNDIDPLVSAKALKTIKRLMKKSRPSIALGNLSDTSLCDTSFELQTLEDTFTDINLEDTMPMEALEDTIPDMERRRRAS